MTSVRVEENPNTDDVTVARSKVAVFESFIVEADDEIRRMTARVAKADELAAMTRDWLATAEANKVAKTAGLAEARAELEAAITAEGK